MTTSGRERSRLFRVEQLVHQKLQQLSQREDDFANLETEALSREEEIMESCGKYCDEERELNARIADGALVST